MSLLELLQRPWPWYVAGPIIGAVYLLLLYFGRSFGISASLRAMCSALGAGRRIAFFRYDWKGQAWNLVFILGSVLGGAIAMLLLKGNAPQPLASGFVTWAADKGIDVTQALVPSDLFSWSGLGTVRGLVCMVGGGFLVGFGARWAGGCTSGHAISGLSNLQLPSLVAVIGFFIGGLFTTWVLLPILLRG